MGLQNAYRSAYSTIQAPESFILENNTYTMDDTSI